MTYSGSNSAPPKLGVLLTMLLWTALSLLSPNQAIAQSLDHEAAQKVTTTWKLLDYMAVDYGGAVANGKVVSTGEYAEMREFAGTIAQGIAALPDSPEKASLQRQARQLRAEVDAKASAEQIATTSQALSAALLANYPVPVAPKAVPDLGRGATLFAQNCAACHGARGDGKGPGAASLSTPPVAFTDIARARKRSLAALEQVIAQGIDGTAMQSYRDLPDADRWALALHAGGLAFSPAQVRRGETLWQSDAAIRAKIPDLKALVTATPEALGKEIGEEKADAVMAYLRAHPEAVTARAADNVANALAVTRAKLSESVAAYRAGNLREARDLSLSAYLDGFEPIEPLLSAKDAGLMANLETRMGAFRAAIGEGVSADDLAGKASAIDTLLSDAERALAPDASSAATTFAGAFAVLLREGLEALLIVVAMLAFLERAERRDALRYVHGGWTSALLAGGATWAVATYAIGISGASRELTEGFGSLLAAVVLLSVGIWMHGKAQAGQWQRYIQEKLAKALGRKSGWFLFGLAFVVVYREVFETILFFAALWSQGSGAAILEGTLAAVLVLAGTAWAMLRYSRQLPIASFFRYSSWLMAALTVILVGKGVAALQEAGLIDIAPLTAIPRISMLGLFPTMQSLAAQIGAFLLLVLGFALNRRRVEVEQEAY